MRVDRNEPTRQSQLINAPGLVTAILDDRRRLAYKTLTARQRKKSEKPLIQNFESRRILDTIKLIEHALGLKTVAQEEQDFDRVAILLAIRAHIQNDVAGTHRYDLELVSELLKLLDGAFPREKQPDLTVIPAIFSEDLDKLWTQASASLHHPASRAQRAYSRNNIRHYCPLQHFFWSVERLSTPSALHRIRSYICMLSLRDGITLAESAMEDVISNYRQDTVSIEYFCTLNNVSHYDPEPAPSSYVGVSFVGGDVESIFLHHCLSDRQENDREIADWRGHITGEKVVEARAEGMGAVLNLAIVEGAVNFEPDFILSKSLRVYNSIIGGLTRNSDDATRVAIRAVGDIHRVPFEALSLPFSNSDELFGDRFAVSYTSESSVADCKRDPTIADPNRCLVVADCDYDDADCRGELLELGQHGSLFNRLPGAAAEGDIVASILNSDKISGTRASRKLVEQAMERSPKILHFATHSFFVDRTRFYARDAHGQPVRTVAPMFSGKIYSAILLSGANDHVGLSGRVWLNEEGILGCTDILKLDLSSTNLVTLSSCESGIGAIEFGNELESLREAFLAAGAKHVVSSLWPVKDSDTKIFMRKFYEYLERGNNIDESLKRARGELVDLPIESRCAFVVLSDGVSMQGGSCA